MLGCETYGSIILGDVTFAISVVAYDGGIVGGTTLVNIVAIYKSENGAIIGGESPFKRIQLMVPSGGGLAGGLGDILSIMHATSSVVFIILMPSVQFRLYSDSSEVV